MTFITFTEIVPHHFIEKQIITRKFTRKSIRVTGLDKMAVWWLCQFNELSSHNQYSSTPSNSPSRDWLTSVKFVGTSIWRQFQLFLQFCCSITYCTTKRCVVLNNCLINLISQFCIATILILPSQCYSGLCLQVFAF